MTLIDGAELPQRVQLILGRITALGHHAIQDRRRVALRQNKAVAIWPLGISRIVPHHIKKQRDQDLDRRKRSAGMAGLGMRDHLYDFPPDLLGNSLQLFYVTG